MSSVVPLPPCTMWHPTHAAPAPFRNTFYTRTPSSTSTHLDDDSRHIRRSHRDQPRAHACPRQSILPVLEASPAQAYVGSLSKEAFVVVVARELDRRADENAEKVLLPTYSEPESVFFSVSRPEIPTRDYVRRLVMYTQCSPSAFVVMLIYLDRIAFVNRRLRVTPYNLHRLLVTALTLACKMLDDRCFSNVHYAKVGGIPTAREMNRLELQYLQYVDYKLHVDLVDFQQKQRSLEISPPPSSPVSVADMSSSTQGVFGSRFREDNSSSVSSSSSAASRGMDRRYRGCAESTCHTSQGMSMLAAPEKWYSTNRAPPPDGKRLRKDGRVAYSDSRAPHRMQIVYDVAP